MYPIWGRSRIQRDTWSVEAFQVDAAEQHELVGGYMKTRTHPVVSFLNQPDFTGKTELDYKDARFMSNLIMPGDLLKWYSCPVRYMYMCNLLGTNKLTFHFDYQSTIAKEKSKYNANSPWKINWFPNFYRPRIRI